MTCNFEPQLQIYKLYYIHVISEYMQAVQRRFEDFLGGGPRQGRSHYAREVGLPLSLWKKNGNHILSRCLLKHYKIRIFQMNTAYKYW